MQSIPSHFAKLHPESSLLFTSNHSLINSFSPMNYFPNITARLPMIREIIIQLNSCHFLDVLQGRFRKRQRCRSELTLLGWNVTGGLAFRLMKKIIVWIKIIGHAVTGSGPLTYSMLYKANDTLTICINCFCCSIHIWYNYLMLKRVTHWSCFGVTQS